MPLILISCEKEKIVEVLVEKEFNWKTLDGFQYNDVVQMNGYATDDRIFFLGHNSFTSIVSDSINHPGSAFGGNVARYDNWYEQPSDRKLPICADYFLSYNQLGGWLVFIPTMNPVTSDSQAYLNIDIIDSTYGHFDFVHFSLGECIAINRKNQSLIPYISYIESKNVLKLALVDVEVEKPMSYYQLKTTKVKILKVPDAYQYNVIAIESIGDYFFLSTNSKVYRIDSLGNIENVLDTRLYRFIEISEELYGFGYNNIYISSDNGLTWDKGYEINPDLKLLNYTKINNKLIGYRFGQLWELSIDDNELIVNELDNDGLDGVSITSVNKFDNKVYLSSLSGVYYKSIDDFFEYKIEQEN